MTQADHYRDQSIRAERLARDGYDLVLIARRRERLEALAERLRREADAHAEVLAADLTDAGALARVEARVSGDESLALLINNAGFGSYGPFVQVEPEVVDHLIDIHVRAVARLTRAAVPGMVRRGAGGVINIASLLALSGSMPPNPLPHRSVYAGAKAFIVTFTQAVAGELVGTGVRVQVCLPGLVATEFHTVQGMDLSTHGDTVGLERDPHPGKRRRVICADDDVGRPPSVLLPIQVQAKPLPLFPRVTAWQFGARLKRAWEVEVAAAEGPIRGFE